MFFFNDPAPTEIYTLSLHDALPIYSEEAVRLLHGSLLASVGGNTTPAPSITCDGTSIAHGNFSTHAPRLRGVSCFQRLLRKWGLANHSQSVSGFGADVPRRKCVTSAHSKRARSAGTTGARL